MPINWGPVSAWMVMVVALGSLALVEYLRRYFISKEQHDNEAKKLARETERLEREIAGRLERIERSIETKMVTQDQHKVFGERIGAVEEKSTEARAEARFAKETSAKASSDVEYLTRRMEEMIAGALKELRTQVQILGEQRRTS